MEKELFDIFFEIVNGASSGTIPTIYSGLKASFATIIDGKFSNRAGGYQQLTLHIRDFNLFMNTLKEYAQTILNRSYLWCQLSQHEHSNRDYLRANIGYLLTNMTEFDFENPVHFIERYTNFLKDTTFENSMDFHFEPLDCNIHIERQEQPSGQETPYALAITLEKEIAGKMCCYRLPLLRYGVSNQELYLYAIQNVVDKKLESIPEEIQFSKKVNRYFYKLNQGASEQFLDIPPSFLFAESILLQCMRKEGIESIHIPKRLPLKIMIKQNVFGDSSKYAHMSESKLKALGIITNVDEIEHNLTTRFLHVQNRLMEQIKGIGIMDDQDSFLSLCINCMELRSENQALNAIMNSEEVKRNRASFK